MLFLLIIILAAVAQWFLPWWVLPVVAVVVAFWAARGYRHAATHAFLAGFLLWGGFSAYLYMGGSSFADQVADILFLPNGWLLVLITGLLGGILATLGGVLGYAAHDIFKS